jgi:imidazolonepropionase-like amidohydrolase
MPTAHLQPLYLRAAHLFNGTSGALLADAAVVVEGDRIIQVGTRLPVPPGARVVDLGERTLMPGMIDAHTHLTLHAGPWDQQVLRESSEFRAIAGTVTAAATLRAGITTIRDVGNEGSGGADIALREAIAAGLVPGPRMLTAIQPLVTSGAYRFGGLAPEARPPVLALEADGPDALRAGVRELIARGADLIKVYLDCGRKPQGSPLPSALTYAQPELDAIVQEAHRAGLRVAAHAITDPGVRMGIRAGVDSIEHGQYVEAETFRMMAAQGITYVPTLLVYELWAAQPELMGMPRSKAQLEEKVAHHHASFRRALEAQVRIAFGTDLFVLPGANPRELASMVRLGLPPVDALRAATSVSAALLGLDRLVGSLEPGKAADIIAVPGNPVEDITAVERTAFVMKGGAVFLAC